jgi:Tfp pilus assembly protein PilP
MNRLHWVTGLSLVALLLGSCTSDRKISQAPTPKPSVGQVAVNPQLPAPTASQKITKPAPGLTLPTSAIDLPIPQGRRDPFGSVAVSPVKQPVSPQTARSQQTLLQAREAGQTKQRVAKSDVTSPVKTNPTQTVTSKQQSSSQQKATTRKQQSSSQQEAATTKQQSSSQQKAATPDRQSLPKRQNPDRSLNLPPAPAPSTDLASSVEVKGVMKVGERISAIVKTPNEPSRSVSAGDYLSGGAVRVKRIELGVDREPVVVLEQNGIEVVKAVSSNNSPIASL